MHSYFSSHHSKAFILIALINIFLLTWETRANAAAQCMKPELAALAKKYQSQPDPCPQTNSGKTIVVGKNSNINKIQDALNMAMPGDKIEVESGTYPGGITFPRGGSPQGCISLIGKPGAIIDGGNFGIKATDKSFISITGFTIQNMKSGDTPTGIRVEGSSQHVKIQNNIVQNIENTKNAHAITVYGTGAQASSDIFVDGNEIRNCKLGASEALAINGNVKNFIISKNKVHDVDNIGIDMIGHEDKSKSGSDQASIGLCIENKVYNITSKKNPAYKGGAGADGIYVDGGRDIIIMKNKVHNVDIGIEVASERQGRNAEDVFVLNNNVSNSAQGNIMVGGENKTKNGGATSITIAHNQLSNGKQGQIVFQNNVSGALEYGNHFSGAQSTTAIVGSQLVSNLTSHTRTTPQATLQQASFKPKTDMALPNECQANSAPELIFPDMNIKDKPTTEIEI